MSRIETTSHTGQNAPPPDKNERDNAFSTGGGRKAEAEFSDRKHPSQRNAEEQIAAPVGLDLETRSGTGAQQFDAQPKDSASSSCCGERSTKIDRTDNETATEQLMERADELEDRNKPTSAQKARDVAAKITLQQQNELDGFPIKDV